MNRIFRVVLTGSESTGKTELADALAAHYDVPRSAEFAREYLARRQAAGEGVLGPGDVEPIAHGQIALENEAVRAAIGRGARLVVHDTDLLSTMVYAWHYYRECPAWIVREARERLADLYLLCDTDVPWVPDPQRDAPHEREAIQGRFVETLSALDTVIVPVSGAPAARLELACGAIDARLRRA